MISNTDELYAEVYSLIDHLNQQEEEHWGTALSEAMSISSSSTEILGESRSALRKLRASQVPDRLGLTRRVDEALS